MSKALDRAKKCRHGHREVVTKHLKHILESDADLDEKHLVKLKALSELPREKFHLLKTLDEEVLAMCPTEEIEQVIEPEIKEAKCRIMEICTELDGYLSAARLKRRKLVR